MRRRKDDPREERQITPGLASSLQRCERNGVRACLVFLKDLRILRGLFRLTSNPVILPTRSALRLPSTWATCLSKFHFQQSPAEVWSHHRRKKAARGRSAEKRSILPTLKYAAAWAYEFVWQEWEKALQDRYIPLQRAAERFNTERERPCHDPIEMAAFLILNPQGA